MTQAFNLAILANAVDTSGRLNVGTNATGTLPVANGGSGAATLAANNVLLGNGTSAFQAVAPSTSGNVLTSNGTTWVSSTPAGGGVTSLNGQTGVIVNTGAGVIGSYFAGGLPSALQIATRGSTYAGSSLRSTSNNNTFVNFSNFTVTNPSYAGTWRAMGNSKNSNDCGGEWQIIPNLFVRIS